jgi:AcrR family transcriptional regulator
MTTRRDNPYWRTKHEKISEAAFEEFTTHGFELASMEKIAESAGVSKVTVYNHFETKDRLFADCLEYFFEFIYRPFEFSPSEAAVGENHLATQYIEKLVDFFLHPTHLAMLRLIRSEHARIESLGINKGEADLYPPTLIDALARVLPVRPERAGALAEVIFSTVQRRCFKIGLNGGFKEDFRAVALSEILGVIHSSELLSRDS